MSQQFQVGDFVEDVSGEFFVIQSITPNLITVLPLNTALGTSPQRIVRRNGEWVFESGQAGRFYRRENFDLKFLTRLCLSGRSNVITNLYNRGVIDVTVQCAVQQPQFTDESAQIFVRLTDRNGRTYDYSFSSF